MSETHSKQADGRNERSRTSRAKILQATLDLILQEARQPSAKEVADLANVGLRSVFRHFSDMESLFADLNTLVWAQADKDYTISPETFELPLAGRVQALISWRLRLFANYGNLIETSTHMSHHSPMVKSQYAGMIKFLHRQAINVIPELEQLNREQLGHAHSVVSFEFFHYNRVLCNRPIEEVEALCLAALTLILSTRDH
jgi:AcrR family transcriptional regulator